MKNKSLLSLARHARLALIIFSSFSLLKPSSSLAFEYHIFPNTEFSSEVRIRDFLTGTFCLAAATGLKLITQASCAAPIEASALNPEAHFLCPYVDSPAVDLISLPIVSIGLAKVGKAIAPEFLWSVSPGLCRAVDRVFVPLFGIDGIEINPKLRYITNSTELRDWQAQDPSIFRIATDEFRRGELQAVLDLMRFSQGHWNREALGVHLLNAGVDEATWIAREEAARVIIAHGAPAATRDLMYRFLEQVRTAEENLHRAVVDAGMGLLAQGLGAVLGGFAEVGPDGEVIIRPLAVPAIILANPRPGDQHRPIVLPAEVMPFVIGVQEMFAAQNHAVEVHEGADINPDGAPPAITEAEENMLLNLPFLRELYTHGPGNDIMSTHDFRAFLITHIGLLRMETIHFFQIEENLVVLRALPTVEARQAHILEQLGAE